MTITEILISIAAAGAGYLIGAFPTAYLALQRMQRLDIRRHGSGNVGARNIFDLTRNVWMSLLVGLVDAGKGALAVYVGTILDSGSFLGPGVAAFFAVTGHNYNIFLRGHGGRGLATAAGAALAMNPLPLVFFGLMWLTGYYVIRRNVFVANVVGVLGAAALLFNAPISFIDALMFVPCEQHSQLKFLFAVIGILIAIRHVKPIREQFGSGGQQAQPAEEQRE